MKKIKAKTMVKSKEKHVSSVKWLIPAVVAGVILVLGSGVGVFLKINSLKSRKPLDSVKIVAKVGRHMVLPEEQPKIIEVTDLASKSNSPDFLKDAKLGDQILEYKNGAVLFDPKSGKILNVFTRGALNRGEFKPLTIAIRYNGGTKDQTPERVIQFKDDIVRNLPEISVMEMGMSGAKYQGDVIYLVNKSRKEDAVRFAELVGGSPVLEVLEPGETITNADIIVSFRDSAIR